MAFFVTPLRAYSLVANNAYKWETGQTLKVLFLDGNMAEQKAVISAFKVWLNYINLNVEYYTEANKDEFYDIRVTVKPNFDSSRIGKEAHQIAQDQPTLTLGSAKILSAYFDTTNAKKKEAQGTLLHEVAHALAFQHEHQHPNFPYEWKRQFIEEVCINRLVRAYKKIKTDKSPAEIEQTIEDSCDRDFSKFTPEEVTASDIFDERSIMTYEAPSSAFINGAGIDRHNKLSAADREWAAKIYPF
ncbi:MAG: hypothetical protein KDD38_09205 [Bdellovibrionales bacterium]|nr:hypothetical protein [Bdellovibrionales bacterium]